MAHPICKQCGSPMPLGGPLCNECGFDNQFGYTIPFNVSPPAAEKRAPFNVVLITTLAFLAFLTLLVYGLLAVLFFLDSPAWNNSRSVIVEIIPGVAIFTCLFAGTLCFITTIWLLWLAFQEELSVGLLSIIFPFYLLFYALLHKEAQRPLVIWATCTFLTLLSYVADQVLLPMIVR